MGKSYKKHPAVSTIVYNGSKRRSNKKVRRTLKDENHSFDRKQYRKIYDTWEIRDYKEIAPSFETFYKIILDKWYNPRIHTRRIKDTPPTREECLKLYKKWYVRK